MAYKWFFLRCQSGREKRIRQNAEQRLKMAGLEDLIPQVLVPFELVTDLRRGKKKVVEKKLYPGYLMVQADLDSPDDVRVIQARNTLRTVDGLRDFLGSRGEPTSITEAEVTSILSRMQDSESRPQVSIGLNKGDMVRINTGPFDGFDGAVEEIDPESGTVKITVTIFGRPTPVDLKYWEVEAV
ncbi:MAG: transcription termination/antitermination protein NusG [Planctomycetota bacterium]|jgi:transcriptional antiterminator NusG|nr:transcription termination/antitermination protein NusG [Planctomycetota bacterium]